MTTPRTEEEFKSLERLLDGKEELVSINAISFLTHLIAVESAWCNY